MNLDTNALIWGVIAIGALLYFEPWKWLSGAPKAAVASKRDPLVSEAQAHVGELVEKHLENKRKDEVSDLIRDVVK